MRLVLACVLALGTASAQSAPTVHVGDGTLDGSFLKPYNNAWFYTAKLSDSSVHPQGIWSDHLQWTTVNGKPAMLRVQGVTFVTGASNVILNTFDPKTLAPLTSEMRRVDGTIRRRTFDGRRMTSVELANAKDTKAPDTTDLAQPIYDFNGGMYGILLASLPFTEGLTGTLPAIGDDSTAVRGEPFRVLHQEEVSAGSHGKVKAWVVESTRPGEYTMHFWLTKTPPYIIKLVMTDQAHGRILTWEML